MKEHPILFSPAMVLAILEGRKVMTRRILSPQPAAEFLDRGVVAVVPQWPQQDGVRWFMADGLSELMPLPYAPGDRLWVREAWATSKSLDNLNGTEIAEKCAEAGYQKPWCPIRYKADGAIDYWEDWEEKQVGRPRHARFMPRWASRLTLEVTAAKVERLQDISEEDAIKEGAELWPHHPEQPMTSGELGIDQPFRGGFACLWDDIHDDNPNHTWYRNPWVAAYGFKVVTK